MRCDCCDKNLNDYESTRKHAETGEYLNTCNACMQWITGIPVIDRDDLNEFDEIHDDNFQDEEYDPDLDGVTWDER